MYFHYNIFTSLTHAVILVYRQTLWLGNTINLCLCELLCSQLHCSVCWSVCISVNMGNRDVFL